MSNHGPDWGVIGGAVVTIAGVIGAVIAGAKGVFSEKKSERQRESDSSDARLAQRDRSSIDHTALTLENVFKLVNELQEEVVRKDSQIVEAERRCTERVKQLEARIVVHEAAIAGQAATIIDLERQIRAMGWPPPSNLPPGLT